MHTKYITAEDLLNDARIRADRRRYAPTEPGLVEEQAVVRKWTNCGIPALTFEWTPEHFVSIDTEVDAFRVADLGYHVVRSSGSNSWHTYARKTHRESRTFMNFRRYAWSWTEDPTGQHGYSRGPCYANGHIWGGLATTPEEVVRLTAVEAITGFSRELPPYFWTREVQQLLAELVQDGVRNARPQHAQPAHVVEPFRSQIRVLEGAPTRETFDESDRPVSTANA